MKSILWLTLFGACLVSMGFGASQCQFFWGLSECSGIFWQLRLPRTLGAVWSGFVLSGAGVLSQGLFRNPLASPGILGVSQGAAVGVSCMFLFGSLSFLPFAALAGSLFVGAVMLSVSRTALSSDRLLLSGVALAGFLGAVQSLIVSRLLNSPGEITVLMQWMLGGVAAVGYERLWFGCPLGLFALPWIPKLCHHLNLSLLGEERALSLGVDMKSVRLRSVWVISLLVSSGILVAGLLPFVALVVPHLTRQWIGVKHRELFLYAGVSGAIAVVLADCLGRFVGGVQEIEAGIMMGLLGSPCFFWMLKTTSRAQGSR